MKTTDLHVIKLGGSVITDKDDTKESTIKRDVIKRLAREMKKSNKRFVVVHGAGSWGHPQAKSAEVHLGELSKLSLETRMMGIARTRLAVTSLNQVVVETLIEEGFPAVSIHPFSVCITKSTKPNDLIVRTFHVKTLLNALNKGLTPVLFGDVTFDETISYTILSGDVIMAELARILSPRMLIYATDVDGLYDKDPKKEENVNAKLFKRLTFEDLKKSWKKLQENAKTGIKDTKKIDVTGTFLTKIKYLLKLNKIPDAIFFNANRDGLLYKILTGKSNPDVDNYTFIKGN